MGGLVVKKVHIDHSFSNEQAIVDSYNDRSYGRVLRNVKAIVFFGTPHRGTDLARLLSHLLSISFSQKIFVEQLHGKSDLIRGINDQFRDRSESLELVSFYESKEMPVIGVLGTKSYLIGYRSLSLKILQYWVSLARELPR